MSRTAAFAVGFVALAACAADPVSGTGPRPAASELRASELVAEGPSSRVQTFQLQGQTSAKSARPDYYLVDGNTRTCALVLAQGRAVLPVDCLDLRASVPQTKVAIDW